MALTDDGHERVKVADVETLLRHVDEELYDASSVFLLHWLLRGKHHRRKMIQLLQKTYFGVKLCMKDDTKPCVGFF